MTKSLQRPELLTAVERVTQGLRTAITSGVLPSGRALRQEEIAAQYHVSRMPVREALRQLEAEGLLIIYPNRGAFVATLDPQDIAEIYEIRILLECDALRRAFPTLTSAVVERAASILDQLDVEQNSDGWSKLDDAFHTTLYAPAQRPRLLELIATLRRQVTHVYYLANPLDSFRTLSQQEHRQIVAACRGGDLTDAIAALEHHLHSSARSIAVSSQRRLDAL